ncbi:TonB-dependent receptor [Tistrella mobilis]|uniref:TonB-dependent receptor plug domain-containing protein n=1 Tax=Tistrella mobilis TaxID=171437 RepID=UPI00355696EE
MILRQTAAGACRLLPATACAAAALALGTPLPARADDIGPQGGTDLPALSVTARRGSPQALEDVPASIEVIDRARLDAVPATTVARAIEQATGVIIADGGATTRFSIRGFEDGQALILVDGHRRRGRFGNVDLSAFDLGAVDRIEIIRGPMSALYGADAVSGVVNIISRDAAAEPGASLQSLAGVSENGERLTRIGRAAVETGRVGQTRNRLDLSIRSRDPWSEAGSAFDDLKGESSRHAAWRTAWDVAPGHEITLDLGYEELRAKGLGSNGGRVPMPVDSREHETSRTGSLTWAGEVGPGRVTVSGSAYRTEGDVLRTGSLDTTRIDGRELTGFYTLPIGTDHVATVGFEYLDEDIDLSVLAKGSADRRSRAAVAQDEWMLAEDWTLLAGIRTDDFSDVGTTTNPRATLSWTPGPWILRIGAGTAFKAPTYLQLYSIINRGRSVIYGNADLEPETSWTAEAAAAYRFANGAELGVTAHHSEVEDLITTRLTAPGRYDYTNIGTARIRGVEITGRTPIGDDLMLTGSLEWIDARDTAADERLGRRPRQQGKIGLDWAADDDTLVHLAGTGMLSYYAPVGFGASNLGNVSSDYGRIDVKVSHRLTPLVEISGGVDGLIGTRVPDNLQPFEPAERFFYLGVNLRY